MTGLVAGLSLALFGAACGGKGGGGDGGGGTTSAGGIDFAEQSFEFPIRRSVDNRELMMQAKGPVPKGWAPDPKAKPGNTMKTLLPPNSEGKSIFSMSNVTISATCHGSCQAKKMPENIKGAAAMQLKMAGSDAKVLKDEKIKDGVWGFIIEKDSRGKKAYTLGVSHWGGDGWPYVLFCNAHLQGDFEEAYQAVYDACAKLDVELADPKFPAETLAKETENLKACPKTSKITYKQLKPMDKAPEAFGDVKATLSGASRAGSVMLYIANFDMTTSRFRDAPLTAGQVALKLAFYHTKDGEVLSGSYPTKHDKADVRVDVGIHVEGGTMFNMRSGDGTKGSVDIIARTEDKICGKIDLQDDFRHIQGEFVSDLKIGSVP